MIKGAGIFRTKLPLGFTAGGINCGVRLYRPDLGVIISESPATAVGVFTRNHCKAAPIKYSMACLPSKKIKAIITNSGEANAATGNEGEQNNFLMAKALAQELKCDAKQIITASTGVIGKPLSINKITHAIPELVKKTCNIAENFATAILTTDLVPKTVYQDLKLSTGIVRITGIAKGSGMIHPNMATMLAYFLSDVQIDAQEAQVFLQKICDESFNMISVDGETSTNDCAFFMANGASQKKLVTANDKSIFYQALLDLAVTLAKSIARDGEGASKLITATVTGSATTAEAKSIAKAIISSPLIKTAVYGQSPNWGRVLASIGNKVSLESSLHNCVIAIQGIDLFSQGHLVNDVDLSLLKNRLSQDEVQINIQFFQGNATAIAWGCDLTEKYIQINAEYLT